jgi:hypothetical protein
MSRDGAAARVKSYRRRRAIGAVAIRFACLPTDLVGLLFVAAVYAFWGKRGSLGFRDGVLVAELARGSWPDRTWFRPWAGITIGHAVLFGAAHAAERVWVHEHVHVAGAVALAGSPLGALCVWALPFLSMVLGGFAAAWLRGGDAYRDSAHERAAYAISDAACVDAVTSPSRPATGR